MIKQRQRSENLSKIDYRQTISGLLLESAIVSMEPRRPVQPASAVHAARSSASRPTISFDAVCLTLLAIRANEKPLFRTMQRL
jgi:hypothetical protein